jgi:hypothetical protein
VPLEENLLVQQHGADQVWTTKQSHTSIELFLHRSRRWASRSEAAVGQHWCLTATAAGSITDGTR